MRILQGEGGSGSLFFRQMGSRGMLTSNRSVRAEVDSWQGGFSGRVNPTGGESRGSGINEVQVLRRGE